MYNRDLLIKDNAIPDPYLSVRPSGNRYFAVRVKRNAELEVHTLGAWHDTKLKDARIAAQRGGNSLRF